MTIPNILQFFIQSSESGGYTAQAINYSIYTEGETLDETVHNIREAVDCHFGEDEVNKFSIPITVNFVMPVTA